MNSSSDNAVLVPAGEAAFQAVPRRAAPAAASFIIAASIVLVTILHFLTPINQVIWHEVYQRIYYIPIIAAALLFGLRGGLAASLFATVIYFPHIYLHRQQSTFDYAINQYAETVIFNVIGVVMGILGDRLRRARIRAEQNAEERKNAYIELQQTFEQLLQAEKLAALGELSAGIVHEVRNPLSSIKGAVEIIEDELAPGSSRREFTALAKREVDRLDKLVGEFLRFARPASIAVEPNDLNAIVAPVTSLVENQAAVQSVRIETEFAPDAPVVSADREQIKQVLLNLAINSLHTMPSGGTLTIRTFRSGHAGVVEIEDTGGGIEPAAAPKIFDPFFTTKDKGIGLGLSIAHRIITQHNGSLVYQRGQAGAIFRLELPNA